LDGGAQEERRAVLQRRGPCLRRDLRAQTSLVRRLCESGVQAHVVFGGPKDTKLQDDERRGLESCPNISLVEWPDAGHNTLGQTDALADLIVTAAKNA
jgi:hypothetical protein